MKLKRVLIIQEAGKINFLFEYILRKKNKKILLVPKDIYILVPLCENSSLNKLLSLYFTKQFQQPNSVKFFDINIH